jgi:hypothetical protein
MNRNKKGSGAPKAPLSNQMLQRIESLEKALAKKINEVQNLNQRAKARRGASSGGYDLTNRKQSSGRLGLSSSNSSKVRKTHVLEEDEYIADISGSVVFATTAYPINPGQATSFPWGNKIAQLYEKYEFQMLEFYYRREVSEYATNGQAGKVMLSCDYDASDGPPASKQQVLDTEPHIDAMPCAEQIVLRVDCAQMRKQDSHYVRPGALPVNTDIKTYDAGNLFVSTYGCTNTTVIGELRVRYKCVLSVPVLEPPGVASGAAGSYFQIVSNPALGDPAGMSTIARGLFLSANPPLIVTNGIQATIAATGLITVPAGLYQIEANCTSTLTGATGGTAITAGNLYLAETESSSVAVVIDTPGSGFAAAVQYANISTSVSWATSLNPFVWNTADLGTSIALLANPTYTSGSCFNRGYLKITQL